MSLSSCHHIGKNIFNCMRKFRGIFASPTKVCREKLKPICHVMSTTMTSSANIRYQPLSQFTPSDDEDEGFDDNILYDSRLVNGPKMDRRNVFELEKLGQPRVSSPPSVQYLGRGRRTLVLVTVLLVILLGVVAAVVFPLINHLVNHGIVIETTSGKHSEDWLRVFNNTWTESSVRMFDVDGDKLDDVVFGWVDKANIDAALNRDTELTMAQYCNSLKLSYPCGGALAALRGYDGRELWRVSTRSIVLDSFCGDIDVNGDGVQDCILTGRHSTCQAVDVRTGSFLWAVDPDSREWSNHFMPLWTVYRGPTLPDLDLDGVLDFVILHGRDREMESWEHESTSARLTILSGKTGLPLGKGYLDIPGKAESYMPPVKHVTSKGAIYILFGTGSEKTPGNLMAISLPDLYVRVCEKKMEDADPSLYTWVDSNAELLTLYSGGSKGVMVPPVFVEDGGTTLLLVTTVNGSVTLLDGETWRVKWSKHFPSMEILSSPAPGFYDTDKVLDFLVQANEGSWGDYNSSKTMILNGVDGSTLWSYHSGSIVNSSALSLRTLEESVFLVKVVGRNSTFRQSMIDKDYFGESDLGSTNDSNTAKPDGFESMCEEIHQKVSKDSVMCDSDLEFLTQEIFLLDHVIANRPLKILEQKAFRYHYRLQHKVGEQHCHDLSVRQKDKIDMCAVLVPTSYTGAVGDVDGDGSLDYVHITQMVGLNRSDLFLINGQISNVFISKHSLEAAISNKEFKPLDLSSNIRQSVEDSYRHVNSLTFYPSSAQVWTQYLGLKGNSFYKTPIR